METSFWLALAYWLFFLLGAITALLPLMVYLSVEWISARETAREAPTEPKETQATNMELIRTVRDAVAIELREWRA